MRADAVMIGRCSRFLNSTPSMGTGERCAIHKVLAYACLSWQEHECGRRCQVCIPDVSERMIKEYGESGMDFKEVQIRYRDAKLRRD